MRIQPQHARTALVVVAVLGPLAGLPFAPAERTPAPAVVPATSARPLPAADSAPSAEPAATETAATAEVEVPAASVAAVFAPGQNFMGALTGAGVPPADAALIRNAFEGVLDFRAVRAGWSFEYAAGDRFVIQAGRLVRYVARPGEGENAPWSAAREEETVETRSVPFTGILYTTLSQAVIDAGGTLELVDKIAEVFGYDIDFYSDPRPGDRFRVLVETKLHNDRIVGYGKIQAAHYASAVRGDRWAVLFDPAAAGGEGKAAYYNLKGESLKKSFLTAPMAITKVTSPFGMRFHPIHRRHSAHKGIDYGAKTGTPVWSVADGTVLQAGRLGGCGNAVTIRHSRNITTRYCHFSRVTVRAGQRVSQRQVVGLVGSTGNSTGPHLHFELLVGGNHINPAKRVVHEKGEPVPAARRAAFDVRVAEVRTQLEGVRLPVVMGPATPPDVRPRPSLRP